jgi:hypothetical protein
VDVHFSGLFLTGMAYKSHASMIGCSRKHGLVFHSPHEKLPSNDSHGHHHHQGQLIRFAVLQEGRGVVDCCLVGSVVSVAVCLVNLQPAYQFHYTAEVGTATPGPVRYSHPATGSSGHQTSFAEPMDTCQQSGCLVNASYECSGGISPLCISSWLYVRPRFDPTAGHQ